MPRYNWFSLALLSASCLFAGCKHTSSNQLRIGVTPGPAQEILEAIEPDLATQGIELKIVPFTDYVQPNLALAGHDLDANLYQNVPFLDQFNHDHGTHFVTVSKVYVPLMAIYAGKTGSLGALRDGARISLPNDPVNQARALHLLQNFGLISLRASAGNQATLADVSGSPRHVQLVELDASQLPRSRDDVDLAVINANFALDTGLNPVRDALAHEAADSQYVNVLVANEVSDANLQKLSVALHSEHAKTFILAHYKGAILPSE